MRLALLLCGSLALAQAPAITDAQRLAYRTLERDYYRAQLVAGELRQQIQQQHDAFVAACGGALDEQTLACKETK